MREEKVDPTVSVSATVYHASGATTEYSATFPGEAISFEQFSAVMHGITGVCLGDQPDEGDRVDTSRMFGGNR